jgi:enamine deaminase RidA (YjgF/YER057c/UK114 family)
MQNINPWSWQDPIAYSQAIAADAPARWLFLSGQTSMDADGRPTHPGDMAAQMRLSFDNIETVLAQAGGDLSHVVRLNVYTTDVDATFAAWNVWGERLGEHRPTCTLLGVARLAFPELLVELEATALLPA